MSTNPWDMSLSMHVLVEIKVFFALPSQEKNPLNISV